MKGFLDKNLQKILVAVLLLSLAVNGYLFWQNRRLYSFYQTVQWETVRDYHWLARRSRENIEKALISSDSGKISGYLEEAFRDLNYVSLLVELKIYYLYGFFRELDFPHSPVRDIIGGMPQEISDDFDIEFLTAAAENLKVVEEELWNIMKEDFPRARRSAGNFVMEKERGALLQAAFQQRLTPLPRRPQPPPQQDLSERARELWEKWQDYEENREEYDEKAREAAYQFWGGGIEREDIYVGGGGGGGSIIVTASTKTRGVSTILDLYLELLTMEVIGQDIYAVDPEDDMGEIPIPKPHRVDLEEGEAIAREFLYSRFGYQDLDLNVGTNREGHLRYVFWQVEEGVVLYFRQMEIEVAADNGEVLTFYRYYKDDLKPEPPVNPIPGVSRAEARGQVNPQNTLEDEGALVARQDGTLCWRFLVEREGWQYRVYIDSQTGEEIAVEGVGSW